MRRDENGSHPGSGQEDEQEPPAEELSLSETQAEAGNNTLTLGQNTVPVTDGTAWYFTPAESGFYRFYAEGGYDTAAMLYCGDEWIAEGDDEDGVNFSVTAELAAGTEYELQISASETDEEEGSAEFTVTVELAAPVSAGYVLSPAEYTLSSEGFNDITCSFESLVLGTLAGSGGSIQAENITFYMNAGTLSDGNGHSIPFRAADSAHEGIDAERVSCGGKYASPDDTFVMSVYIDPDDYADAVPGTYTGTLDYEGVWNDPDAVAGGSGSITLSLTVPAAEEETAASRETAGDLTYEEYSWDDSTKTLSSTTRTVLEYMIVTEDLVRNSSGGTGKGLMSGTYVVTSDTTIEEYVYIRKNQTVDLIVPEGLTLTCKKGIGCGYDKDSQYATLNIYGGGKIITSGKEKAAGIGGGDDESSGYINIHGTTIEATGGKHGAGIGGGEGGKDPDASSPVIRIYAGNITAAGGIDGAGIGGGDEQPGARTYIYSGTVTASSEKHGAGIGGGDEEGTYGVWIYGGTVTATGGEHGAGIGAGEGGGNLRSASDGGGVNILGGNVTAAGGKGGAGIGGGCNEDMSGDITLSGEATVVTAQAGERAAAIGAGDGTGVITEGDMKGTITVDCGSQSRILVYGFPRELVDDDNNYREYDQYSGAGIGAGYSGNMKGKAYILGGNIEIWSGIGAAGIGGGRENKEGGSLQGGEGGTVYAGGGDLTIHLLAWNGYGSQDGIRTYYNEAIGAGDHDYVSGTVYISADKNTTGKYMRAVYTPITDAFLTHGETRTALADERSKKSHTKCDLHITECPHTDHNGSSGLTYTINNDTTHKEKCKFCGYEADMYHTADCICGYSSEQKNVTVDTLNGILNFKVALGNSFTLPYHNGEIINVDLSPPVYYEVTGWMLDGDPSGTVYEAGSDVTVTSDMYFELAKKAVYLIELPGTQNGRITSERTEAKAGEMIHFSAVPDTGYTVSTVSYTYITGNGEEPGTYSYADPVEIAGTDGMYTLTMPQLSELSGRANSIIVSAEFTRNTEQSIFIPETSGGTVTADRETAAADTTVTLTVTPDDGYVLDTISCTDADGTGIGLTKVSSTEYTFLMPAVYVTVSARFAEPSAWKALQAEIDSLTGGTITLNGDCNAGEDDTALVIPDGRSVTIDLNGYTIDRSLYEMAENGSVFVNNGTLTITDSSQEKTGTITGGYSTDQGGGIRNSGTLTIEGGTITGNCAKEGGALANLSGAVLTLSGGMISGNTTHTWGGAGILNQGTMTMSGGEISGNSITAAGMNGAGIWTNDSLTLTGGTITGNTSRTGNGGGIYYSGGTLNLSGSPVVTGNTALDGDNDLFINDGGYVLTITGALTENAKIGIREKTLNSDAFTSGLSGKGTAANFISDHSGKDVCLNADGEAYLGISAPAFRTQSLLLSGQIGVIFYMDLDMLSDEEKQASYMTFEISGKGSVSSDPVPFDAGQTNPKGTLYGFTCYINSIQMADTITATFHYGEEQTMEKQYSVRDYMNAFDTVTDPDDKTAALVHALADYGHYVQPFLASSNHWTLGEDYALMDKFYQAEDFSYDSEAVRTAVEGHAIVRNITGGNIEKISYSLTLDSTTAINLFVRPAAGYTGSFTATASVDGSAVDVTTEKQSDGRYRIRITGISAHLLSKKYTVIVNSEDNGQEAQVTVSALSYVRSLLNNEAYQGDAKEKLDARNAVSALYYYSAAADAYRGN